MCIIILFIWHARLNVFGILIKAPSCIILRARTHIILYLKIYTQNLPVGVIFCVLRARYIVYQKSRTVHSDFYIIVHRNKRKKYNTHIHTHTRESVVSVAGGGGRVVTRYLSVNVLRSERAKNGFLLFYFF